MTIRSLLGFFGIKWACKGAHHIGKDPYGHYYECFDCGLTDIDGKLKVDYEWANKQRWK